MPLKTCKIQVGGKSGCPIKINENEYGFTLTKISKSVSYSPRLKRQAKKQEMFYIDNNNSPFYTPKIINALEKDGIYSVEMEFINAESYSNFLLKQNKHSLDIFITSLHNYLVTNIKNSIKIDYNIYSKLIINKINDLADNFVAKIGFLAKSSADTADGKIDFGSSA